jgi:hypothetical protein
MEVQEPWPAQATWGLRLLLPPALELGRRQVVGRTMARKRSGGGPKVCLYRWTQGWFLELDPEQAQVRIRNGCQRLAHAGAVGSGREAGRPSETIVSCWSGSTT